MKKNLIAIICGIVAASVIITGSLLSFGKMSENESIGSEAALNIALNDAGISKNEAKTYSSVFEREHGKYIFDVDFKANGYEYDYYIDASTGEILKRDAERDAPYQKPTAKPTEKPTETTTAKAENLPQTTKPAPKEQTTAAAPSDETKPANENKPSKPKKETTSKAKKASSDYIGLNAAKKIALQRAGVSSGDVKFTKAKMDYDDGICVYEIDFIKGNTEYDFEINATTGKIREYDKETRQKYPKNSGNSSPKSRYYDDDDYDDDNDYDDYDDYYDD